MIDFVIFILTNGRPNNVHTARSLRNHGYTGKIILVIDDEDKTAEEYLDKFKDVEVFSKKEIAQEFDEADNFDDRRSIVYARNACFKIAEKLGFKYFMQMDDDYTRFEYRVYTNERQKPSFIANLDSVFAALLNFYKDSNFSTISMAQGGDFIGGKHNRMAKRPTLFRKCMNSFICSTDRPFKFIGRINEDVNTYVNKQSIGLLMGTIPFVSLVQNQTQSNKGGMTELYLDSGTYIKSFYTVMFSPSSVYIKPMGDKHLRLHHHVKWDSAVPKLISEKHKKTEE
jgi:hypothetical protein